MLPRRARQSPNPWVRARKRIQSLYGTQAEFAEALGVSQPNVCRAVNAGHPASFEKLLLAMISTLDDASLEDLIENGLAYMKELNK